MIAIEGWARDGLIDKQIAGKIGISEGTFYDWLKRFPQIGEALKRGKAPADTKVENKLYESALGFYVTVKKPIKIRSKKTQLGVGTIEEEHIEYADEQVYIPPNVTAQIYWLKNRRKGVWQDKPEVTQQGSVVDDPLNKLLGDIDEQSKSDI